MRKAKPILSPLVILVLACGTRSELSGPVGAGSSAGSGGAGTAGSGDMSSSGSTSSTSNTTTSGSAGAGGSGAGGGHIWSKSFGDDRNQIPMSIAASSAGAVLSAGVFRGKVDFGGGSLVCNDSFSNTDIYVVKLDAAGNHVFSKSFGDFDDQKATGVAADGAGNVLLAGSFRGTVDFGGGPLVSAGSFDVFAAKFDAAGNHVWSKRFGDVDSQEAIAVAVDGAGNVFLAGGFRATVDFGGGALTSVDGLDIFVTKLGTAGNHLWSKRFGGPNDQQVGGMALDSAGNVLVTGYFIDMVDFGGDILKTSSGDADIYAAKLDAAGNHLWSKDFGDASEQVGAGIAVDGAGNVLLTGYFRGTADFGGGGLTSTDNSIDIYVTKLDAAGNHHWSKRFGDTSAQYGRAIAADGQGNVLLTGAFQDTVDFGGDTFTALGFSLNGFLVKFDAAGLHVWSRNFGGSGPQMGTSIAADGAGSVLLTGYFQEIVDFGGGPLTSAGSADGFIAKLGP